MAALKTEMCFLIDQGRVQDFRIGDTDAVAARGFTAPGSKVKLCFFGRNYAHMG